MRELHVFLNEDKQIETHNIYSALLVHIINEALIDFVVTVHAK